MATKKSKGDIIVDRYASGMFVRQDVYAARVKSLYDDAVDKLLALASQMDPDDDKKFSFADNPRVGEETTQIIRELYSNVYKEIKDGCTAEWEYANLSCDKMIQSAFGWKLKDKNLCARWWDRNQDAVDQFFKRKSAHGGMNLSQKVWKYTGDLRTEMENCITVALGEADTAQEMSRKVRKYLQYPDKLFRRVRDANGKLHLSKAAKAFHPSRGVYRSSYKNAMRLTRTETNAAYRAADEDRWQRMDFVLGYEVKISNNHPEPDICDDLKGKYPKEFKFTAWHPHCRCFVVPILATQDEMIAMQQAIMDGKNPKTVKVQKPDFDGLDKMTAWVAHNTERIQNAVTTPYWIQDNYKYGNIEKGLKFNTEAKSVADAAAARHATRDAKAIADKWHDHKRAELQTMIKDFDIEQNEALTKRMESLEAAFASGSSDQIQNAFRRALNGIQTQKKWDDIVWEGFSKEQKENLREFGNVIGVKKGRRMTHAQADSGHVNPMYREKYIVDPKGKYIGKKTGIHYKKNPQYKRTSKQYSVNCQTCAPVYNLRRMGFNIEAKGNPNIYRDFRKNTNAEFKYMSYNPHTWWQNADKTIFGGKGIHRSSELSEMMDWLQSKPEGTYQIICTWKKEKSGHTFNYIVTSSTKDAKTGKIISKGHFYDPQTNRLFKDLNDFKEYSDEVSKTKGWRYFRIDDRCVNINRVKDLVQAHTTQLDRKQQILLTATRRQEHRDAQAIQNAWNNRRKKAAIKRMDEITQPVSALDSYQKSVAMDKRKLNVLSAIGKGKSAAEVQKLIDRVQQGVDTLQEMEVRKAARMKVVKTATNVINVANKKYALDLGADIAALQAKVDAGDITDLGDMTKALAQKITALNKEMKEISTVIPDAEAWAQQFTVTQLKGVKEAVVKKLAQWSSLSIENQAKKLEFEAITFLGGNMHDCQTKYKTWKVSQSAYLKKLDDVKKQIEVNKVKSELAVVDSYIKTHPKAKKLIDLYDEVQDAISSGASLAEIQAKKDAAYKWYETQVTRERNKQIKKGGSTFDADAYSQARKDAALWDKGQKRSLGKEAHAALVDRSAQQWLALSQDSRDCIYEYSYHYKNLNEPLQGRHYQSSQTRADFERKVNAITEGLAKSVTDRDMWVNRGDSGISAMIGRFNFIGVTPPSDPLQWVGLEFEEGGFCSTCVHKGGGLNFGVRLNIYCPKGTQGMYIEQVSQYGMGHGAKWDGVNKASSISGEQEFLLQRGTRMRITKVEVSDQIYIECEVVSQIPKDLSYVPDSNVHW